MPGGNVADVDDVEPAVHVRRDLTEEEAPDETHRGAGRVVRAEYERRIHDHDRQTMCGEPEGLELQRRAMEEWVEADLALREAGVEAFVYRAYWDTAVTRGYFGPAEQNWGLVSDDNGTAKPALKPWLDLVARSASDPVQLSANAVNPSGATVP